MLKMLNPKDIYTGAVLDTQGNAVKVTCDLLAVVHFNLDSNTMPMPMLYVTYSREDQSGYRAGPSTAHTVMGDELVRLLEESPDGSISVAAIEVSTLRTGIPSANISAKDLEKWAAVVTPYFRDRLIAMTRKILEAEKKARETPLPPMGIPMMPPPGGPLSQ